MTATAEMVRSNGGMTAREDFDSREVGLVAETASIAVAEQAKAAVQARYIMALKRPRDWDQVRVAILKDCKRPRFAQVAVYKKPIGGGFVEGPSIRFVEAALRAMGNVDTQQITLYDDDRKRIVRVSVVDLETNLTHGGDITINKVVERKNPKGRVIISKRQNSQGETTYLVVATDDELANKEAALVSKLMRTEGLRVLPGDIKDEAIEQVYATMRNDAAQDPDAHRKKIADAFADLGVQPMQLAEYLGHGVGTASPAEIVELRGLYQAIKDGESSWSEAVESKRAERGEEAPAAAGDEQAKQQPKTTADLAKRAKAKKADEAPPPVVDASDLLREPGAEG